MMGIMGESLCYTLKQNKTYDHNQLHFDVLSKKLKKIEDISIETKSGPEIKYYYLSGCQRKVNKDWLKET